MSYLSIVTIAKLWSIPVLLQCAVMRKSRMLAVGQYLECRKLIQTRHYSRFKLRDIANPALRKIRRVQVCSMERAGHLHADRVGIQERWEDH